jgi:hypothetical protein
MIISPCNTVYMLCPHVTHLCVWLLSIKSGESNPWITTLKYWKYSMFRQFLCMLFSFVWNKHACRTETYTWYLLQVIHCYDYVWLFYYIILIFINMRVMNRKFKQWSINPPIATEQTTTSHLRSLKTQKRLWHIICPVWDSYYDRWVDTIVGGLLVPEGIIRPVVSVSTLTWFSGCWLILSVYIIMSFDFPFVRLFGVR